MWEEGEGVVGRRIDVGDVEESVARGNREVKYWFYWRGTKRQGKNETHHATAHSPKYTPRNSNRPTPTHHDSQPARGYNYPAAAMSDEGSAGKSRALSRGIDVVFLLGLRLAETREKTREEKRRVRAWKGKGMGKP